ncbi:hypothetical protein J6590_058735 [Homalodisca vitripennis]|nr:hypothetical protein J6590_058735 [Homalodisca vitripennis]
MQEGEAGVVETELIRRLLPLITGVMIDTTLSPQHGRYSRALVTVTSVTVTSGTCSLNSFTAGCIVYRWRKE